MDADIIAQMTAIVARAKMTPGAELEIRFGHTCNGKFTIGVSADEFRLIHERLASNVAIERAPWTKTRSCAYRSNIRVVHGALAPPVMVRKQCIAQLLIPSQGHGIAFKLALSEELPCDDADAPTTPLLFIRLRDRQQFFHGSGGRRTWAYDFTRTQGAPNDELAMHAHTVFEIELEVVDPDYIQEVDPRRIATSMMHRVTELVNSAFVR